MTSRRRVLALIIGSLTLVTVLGAVVTSWVTWRSLIADIDDTLDGRLAQVALALETLDEAQIDMLGGAVPNSAIGILEPDGTPVLFAPVGGAGSTLGRPDVSGERIVRDVGAHFTVPGLDGGPPYRIVSAVIDSTGEERVLFVAEPLDGAQRTIQRLVRSLLVVGVVTLVVLGLLVGWIVRAGLRPLELMIATIDEIASGQYGRRVHAETTRRDVAALKSSVNSMLDTIETTLVERDGAEARLKQFVSDASHELRTPLTTIRGYSEVYLSGAATGPDDVTKQMTRINAEAVRMGGLVDDLLTLARHDQGSSPRVQHFDLSEVVAELVDDARTVAPERDIAAGLSPAPVVGDPNALGQVVANLLTNARVHTPPGTAVRVRCGVTRSGDEVTLEVEDDGLGMSAAEAERAFDRFYQAESSDGTGLGLAICRAIVEAHEGRLELDTSPGAGARFRVLLPAAVSGGE